MRTSRTLFPLAGVLLAVSLAACREAPEAAAARHYQRGVELVEQRRDGEAIIEFRNALKQNPRDGQAYYALAEAYARAGEPEAAGKAFLRAADLLPDRPEVQVHVGTLLLNDGQYDAAKLRAEQVLARAPKHVDALMLLAAAAVGLKQLDSAIADLEEAVRSQPEEPRLQAQLGNLQLARGQTAEAEAALRRAVGLAPDDLKARLSLANYLWAVGRQPEAERELSSALALAPDDPTTNRALAQLYLTTGRPADAESRLMQLAQTGQPAGQLALADFYASTRRFDEARTWYGKVAARELAPVVTARLALVDLADGRPKEAEARLTEALAKAPRRAELLLPLAQLLVSQRRFGEAQPHVDALLTAHPSSATGWLLRGRLLQQERDLERAAGAFRQAVRLNPRLLDAHLELVRVAEASGQPEAAVLHAREAVASWPGSPRAHLALARAYTMRGNHLDARQEAQKALQLRPGWTPALLQLAVVLAAEGRVAEARRGFDAVLARSPEHEEAFAGLVRAALAEGDQATAASLVERRMAARPDDPGLLMLSVTVDQARGDVAGMERALKRVIEIAPDSLGAYDVLGRLYATQQRYEEARQAFSTLAARHPRPANALTMIGSMYEAEGREKEAREHYEKALAKDPSFGMAANNLAWLLAQRDETLADALGYATAAQRALPRQPEVLDTLGWVHYRQGAPQLAVTWFERAVEAAREEPLYRYHLALAYEKLGRGAAARAALEKALASGKRFAGEQDAHRLLRTLQAATAGS